MTAGQRCESGSLRVLHFSDVHVQAPWQNLKVTDMAPKRLVGAVNLVARRGRLFQDAPQKLKKLDAFRRAQAVDAVVCTGDYTALGTEEEHRLAREAVQPFTSAPGGFATVPGNHDLYAWDAVRDERFARYFGDLLSSDWPEVAVEGVWPTVRLWGDSLAVVGVQTAQPKFNPLLSSGHISAAQLAALEGILRDPRLLDRWVFVLVHYAPLGRSGRPDSPHHGLPQARTLGRVCRVHPRALWLHGHIHWCYTHPATAELPISFGAGSATYQGREGAWIYEVGAERLRAWPVVYEEGGYVLKDGAPVELRAR